MRRLIKISMFIIFCSLMVILGAVSFNHFFSFDAHKILEKSFLKERTFQGNVQQIHSKDGQVHAYLMEEHSVPLVAISFGFEKSGRAYETKEGLGVLIESTILDGAGKYSRQNLRRLMKEKGIKVGVDVSADRLDFSLTYVKEFEKEAIDVIKAILYEPHFDEKDLTLARQQLAVVRQQQKENPSYYLGRLVDMHFYGQHPYGRENIADETALLSIKKEDIRAYLQKVMGKDNLHIGMSGDINRKRAEEILEEVFGGLVDQARVHQLDEFLADYDADKAEVDVAFSAQTFVLMLTQGIKRLDKDFYPLYIADYIFGGSGLNSRLNKAVREKEGLTYGIYSYFTNSDGVDLWQIYFSATPENANKAVDIVADEYQRFYQNGVLQTELENAKRGLLNSFNLRFSSLIQIAEMLKVMQVQRLGADFLQKRQDKVRHVTLEEVNTAVRRRLPKTLKNSNGARWFYAKGQKK